MSIQSQTVSKQPPTPNHLQRCKSLVMAVEKLSHTEIEELFKLIHRRRTMYTRNNNGVFLNLTWLDEDTLTCLESYVQFCTRSRTELLKFESICDVLSSKSSTFRKHNLSNGHGNGHDSSSTADSNAKQVACHRVHAPSAYTANDVDCGVDGVEGMATGTVDTDDVYNAAPDDEIGFACHFKTSSSTRFALLKKRFAKQCAESGSNTSKETHLKQDTYICT